MTREVAKKMLPIIQAYVDGKTIQWYSQSHKDWLDCGDSNGQFNPGDGFDYRVKPEAREFWLVGSVVLFNKLDAENMINRFKHSNPYNTKVIHVREVIE